MLLFQAILVPGRLTYFLLMMVMQMVWALKLTLLECLVLVLAL